MGHPAAPMFMPKGKISPLELLKLQAAGKMAGPVPVKTLKLQLKNIEQGGQHQIKVRKDKSSATLMWVSDTDANYVVGQGKKNKTVAAVDMYDDDCYYPVTVKVDHTKNVWVACEYNSSFEGASTVELSSTGTMENAYTYTSCPLSNCDYWYAYGFDEATTSSDVFQSLAFYEDEICNPSCIFSYGGGFEYWPKGSPSTEPALLTVGSYCDPICDNYYMDVDSSGNIWFDYYGYYDGEYGYGLGEITNPTSSPAFVSILKPGSLEFAGGVWVNGAGTKLTVTDQETRDVYVYALPYVASETPTVLGPTPENFFSEGDPVSGGYNSSDSSNVQADAYGWLDLGTVSSNKWTTAQSINIVAPEGASYTPSDK